MVFAPSLAFQRSISLQLWGVQRCWGQGQTLPAPSSTSSCGCFYLQATSSVRGCECYHKWPLCPVQGNRPQDMCFYETVTPQTVSERQLRWDSWKIMSIIWRPVPDVLVDSGPISISQHLRVWSAGVSLWKIVWTPATVPTFSKLLLGQVTLLCMCWEFVERWHDCFPEACSIQW